MTRVHRASGVRNASLLSLAHASPLLSPLAWRRADFDFGPFAARDSALCAELEAQLRLRARGASLEQLALGRERAWRSGSAASLSAYFQRLARELLTDDGGRCRLRDEPTRVVCVDARAEHRIERWRWMSLALPQDFWVAAASTTVPESPFVELRPPELVDRFARQDVALTHVHLSAAQSFGDLWARLMRHAVGVNPKRLRAANVTAGEPEATLPLGGAGAFVAVLHASTVARVVLAWRLRCGRGGLAESIRGLLAAVAAGDEVEWSRRLGAGLRVLLRPDEARASDKEDARWIARRVLHALGRGGDRDAVGAMLGAGSDGASAELRLGYRGMRELDGEDVDVALRRLFWQYQRARAHTFAWVTEEPGTAGLGWFTRHYARMKALEPTAHGPTMQGPTAQGATMQGPRRRSETARKLAAAVRLEADRGPLAALEVRVGPETREGYEVMIPLGAEQAAAREFGFVVHFLRSGARAEPHENRRRLARFGDWMRARQLELTAFRRAIDARPWLLLVVRGFDFASRELATPTWLYAPLFDEARVIGRRGSEWLRHATRSPLAFEPRFTVHAGEEFHALHDGVRRVGELVVGSGRVLASGDRIGHALALGLDPAVHCESSGRLQPADERLHDLLFELELVRSGQLDASGARVERTRCRALELAHDVLRLPEVLAGGPGSDAARRLGGLHVDVERLLTLRRALFRPGELRRAGLIDGLVSSPEAGTPLGDLFRYLTDPSLATASAQPVDVPHGGEEVEMLTRIQTLIRRELARRSITVEANPSSNLLILDGHDLESLPFFRLSHADPNTGAPAVRVSINDDDPLTFATSIADEYAYLYAELMRRGHSIEDALAHLDRARDAGMASRFTLDLRRHALLDPLRAAGRAD